MRGVQLIILFLISSIFGECQKFGEFIPGDATLGYWKLNGTAIDYSGRGNHGTDAGVLYSWARFSSGLQTDETHTAGITIDSFDDFKLQLGDPFTISVWFKTPTLSANGGELVGHDHLTTDNGIETFYDFNLIVGTAMTSVTVTSKPDNITAVASGLGIAADTWINLVFTYTGSGLSTGLSIYINGNLEAVGISGEITLPIDYTDIRFFGIRNEEGSGRFDAYIDEVIVEGMCWDDRMVRNYYNYTMARFSRNN